MEPSGFILNQQLTTFVAGVKPVELVGDRVAPLIPAQAISGSSFTYWVANAKDVLRVRDLKASRHGALNVMDFGFAKDTGLLADYGGQIQNPHDLIRLNEQQPAQLLQVPLNVRMFKSKQAVQAIWISREQELVTAVETAANYLATQTKTAAAGEKFSNSDADVVDVLLGLKDKCLVRPNVAVTSLAAFRALQKHPKVILRTKAVLGSIQGIAGLPSEEEIARVLELDELVVGRQFLNSGKAGDNDAGDNYTRLWGNHFTMFRREDVPPTSEVQYAGTFATFFGNVVQGQPVFVSSHEKQPGEMGLYGGVVDVVGHTRQVKVTFNPGAYHLRSVL
jgi:hypothetical protein